MNELSTTPHGRLLSVAIAISLLGGGISALIHDPMGIALMCVSMLGGVVLTLMAVAMSIDKRASFAVMAIILLPFLMFLYAIGLTVSMHDHTQWPAYGFMAIGAVFGALALRGGKPPAPVTADPAAAH